MKKVRVGLAAALLVALVGWALERVRFGPDEQSTLARVQAQLERQFDAGGETLRTIAAQVARVPDAVRTAPRDTATAGRLFAAVEAALPREDIRRTGITIYDATNTPFAWAGRVSELPRAQLDGPAALYVSPGALGPRLVLVDPLSNADRRAPVRSGTIVVEQTLEAGQVAAGLGDSLVLSTGLVPITLQLPALHTASRPDFFSFVIQSPDGGSLVEAEVSASDLAAVRAQWRRATWAAAVSVVALTLVLLAAQLIDVRRRATDARPTLLAVSGIVALLLAARAVAWGAVTLAVESHSWTSPLSLLLNALVAGALVWLAVDLIERRRFTRPRVRLLFDTPGSFVLIAVAYVATGLLDAALLLAYERFLQAIVTTTTVDLLHFSLHPLDATRLELAFGLVLLHAAVIWTAAVIGRLPTLLWRTSRGALRTTALLSWISGAVVGVWLLRTPGSSVPPAPLLLALATTGACAALLGSIGGRARHMSQAIRLGALFLALLVPAVALYPSLLAFAIQSKERLVATEYGPQALSQRDDLQAQMRRTLDEIDAMPALTEFVTGPPDIETATTVRAFVVWSQTVLERFRLTSAVELYDAGGGLLSHFALNLPEYATARYTPAGCEWSLSDEVSPFGSSERHVLRASRGICERGHTVGGIIVRAMLDYRTLPFISSQSPYLESLRPDREAPVEGVSGRDIEFVVYGWSRAPFYSSGTSVWALPDDAFQRMVGSREPLWATIDRDQTRFRVYLLNDRGGIYALGYPVITAFGHLINLAELVTLTGVLYVLLVGGATLFNTFTSQTPASGRALLREIRSSFYRKLFLFFVLAAVGPVVILAFATQQYFANQSRAGIEQAAAKTATVAQRLVEDYATLQQRGSGAFEALDDDIMVLVSRAIDEDVNLFDRTRLQATSERDLFASRLLSTRTPDDVYRRILLERLPTYVGVQEVGGFSYMLAAAPVRTGGRDGIVTVPVTLQRQEIERQIDELNRRVLLGAVLFSLLGAALGYWMAERIADPVNRLTRATRRIARGDLDARIATTSSDELRRLVQDFNQMAADLQRQREELERTQRLEAWAEMARQVAHDIKNPLTPIQLSAEHAQRVNIDRGRPLSPVLDECVNAILTQVKLLRQISAEFSSFASSPTPHPEPTSMPALLDEVVEPYRTALSERIAIEVTTDPDLPLVTIDRTLFARALTNIIENALHAMPGKGRLTITVRLKPDTTDVRAGVRSTDATAAAPSSDTIAGAPSTNATGRPRASVVSAFRRTIVIEITDTGVGMDPEALSKIFEPYFSTKATGTGLGLTIAKRNVELNGGTIEVASRRGVGTRVRIVLPA